MIFLVDFFALAQSDIVFSSTHPRPITFISKVSAVAPPHLSLSLIFHQPSLTLAASSPLCHPSLLSVLESGAEGNKAAHVSMSAIMT